MNLACEILRLRRVAICDILLIRRSAILAELFYVMETKFPIMVVTTVTRCGFSTTMVSPSVVGAAESPMDARRANESKIDFFISLSFLCVLVIR